MPPSKAKAATWSAGAVALLGALTAFLPQVRPLLADWRLGNAGRAVIEEIRLHALDKPVHFAVFGDSEKVVQVSLFGTGCGRMDSRGRVRWLSSPEHEMAMARRELGGARIGAVMVAAIVPAAGPACRAAQGGQCAIPANHPTWDEQVAIGPPDANGYMPLDLRWHHGCALRAHYNPATGAFVYGAWLCCAHGG